MLVDTFMESEGVKPNTEVEAPRGEDEIEAQKIGIRARPILTASSTLNSRAGSWHFQYFYLQLLRRELRIERLVLS